jgi:beta-glucosidase
MNFNSRSLSLLGVSALLGLLLFSDLSTGLRSAERSLKFKSFPAGFGWCVATSAHQIEGGNTESDWWQWEQTPGHIANGEKSGQADDHWNRVEEDTALLESLHVKTYRLSVEWAKIEPHEGFYDPSAVRHYHDEIALLQSKGIRPFITLQHFSLPAWLAAKGGWEWTGTPRAFANYSRYVYENVAPGVRDWVTVNEPLPMVFGGYQTGIYPPGEKRSFQQIVPVFTGILESHALAYHAVHDAAARLGFEVRLGFAHHLRYFRAKTPLNPLDQLAAKMAEGWNWDFPDAATTGVVKLYIPDVANVNVTIPGLKNSQDFIGVNYYSGDLISVSPTHGILNTQDPKAPKSDLGWDIVPEGFYEVLKEVAKRYPGKPVLITENGVADSRDTERSLFLKEHLAALYHAIQDGVPVEGYCHWSLMDNFEWNHGFSPRFGLYQVDYATQKRAARPSAALFSRIASDNGFLDWDTP